MDVAYFLERHPEFDAVDYDRIAITIEDAEARNANTQWISTSIADQAVVALTAHLLASRWEEMGRATGMATALGNGGQFAPVSIEDELKTTQYGARYSWLLNYYAIGTGFAL